MPGRRLLAVIVVLVAGIAAVIDATPRAGAHPLGNFTVNRYTRIELYRDSIHLHYVLDFAEIPTFQLMETIDVDRDGVASPDELNTYWTGASASVLANIDLRIAETRLVPQAHEGVAQMLPGQGGLSVLRVDIRYVAPVAPQAAFRVIQFADRNFEDRLGWKEIVVRPSEGAAARVAPALMIDTSDALRSYPEASLPAPDARAVTFEWTPGTGASSPSTGPLTDLATPRTGDQFSALIARPRSVTVIVASLLAAFWFGALHALGPGHGKTVVAAYLVGTKGTVRHACALGVTVTATHTAMVYLLGFVTIAASAFIVPERLYTYLGIASGIGVLAMGAGLFASRVARLRREHTHQRAESAIERRRAQQARAEEEYALQQGWGPRPQALAFAGVAAALRSSQEAAPQTVAHRHGWGSGAHTHGPMRDTAPASPAAGAEGNVKEDRVTWRAVLTLGVAGGLLPCPSALLVMLAAISLGQVIYGMLLIVAFSAGLAVVLTGIGIALVVGRRLNRYPKILRSFRRPALVRVASFLPAASALGIAVAGLLMTLQAGRQVGL